MPPTQLPLGLAQPHNNQQLFSDHYLNVTLPQRPEWRLLAPDAARALAVIAPILRAFQPSQKEAQTEDDLIKPVLRALGHSFEVQAALRTPDGTKQPDYLFYRDQAARDANKATRVLDEAALRGRAFAVGDAKHWDRPLDSALKGAGDPFSNKNPAYQIAFYIQHSGLDWGILTNGRLWRLYHRDSAYKQDRYYEVDLPALVEAGDAEAFLFFFAFFGRAAFDEQPLGLAALLRESAEYARAIGASLRTQVYDALTHLAQGWLDYPANQLRPDPATLRLLYDHSLIVLYRLLFILYAEARELLPLRTSAAYRADYSLDALKREIAQRISAGATLLPTTARFWARLKDLFQIIDTGSLALQVATFNGGLFDPARYPFLERATVGDARLLAAIDKLARVAGAFVDYRDLAERHLGTIYEGLLEYHLEPDTSAPGFTIGLFNDRGERHRTGSYYTPDFVVQYIVAQTLRPVLDAAVAGQPSDHARIAAVLAVNCLDPAMGSGHFPVAAMEYIARYLVDLGLAPDEDGAGEADLAYWKRRVAQSCIYGVDLNPLAVDLAKLSLWLATAAKDKPLSFLDHHLRCGNALVGVRIAALRIGEQGSGVRKGGRKRPDPRSPIPGPSVQLSMLDDAGFVRSMGLAVDSMWLIEASAGNTIIEVREQERLYAELRATLTRSYQRLADVAAARDFGLSVDATLWRGLSDYLTRAGGFALPQYAALLDAADAQATSRRFFHWDLEFPEVFFDMHGQPLGDAAGFDAVIGNPPYVRQEQLAPLKPYLQAAYAETYHGMADLYIYFYQQGLRLLRRGGRMSYIVTNKWLRAGYGEPLRAFFARESVIEQIIDFGHAPIFEDADVFPCIIVLAKPTTEGGPQMDQQVQVTAFPREALKLVQLDGYVQKYGHAVPQRRFTGAPWSLEASDVDDLMEKLRRVGVPLTEFAGVKPYFGIKTGLNEAFLIDTPTKERLIREDPRSADIIRPFLRGQDMDRWGADWRQFWLIVLKSSGDYAWPWSTSGEDAEAIFQQSFPGLYQHFKLLEDRLRQRQDKGRYWWELRACSYYDRFEQPKIFYPDITWRSQFSVDTQGRFSNNTVYFLPTDSVWLLTVLNSPLMWSFCWREAVHGKDEALRFFSEFVEHIPIAPPSDATRAEVEPAVERLIAITRANQAARRDTLDWLRTEFEIETPGQKLEAFAALDSDGFVEEVRKRRAKHAGKLSPAALRALRDGYAEQALPVQQRQAEALGLERRLANLVNQAYGLTPAEIALLWRTAPPRMPVGRPDDITDASAH
jgi:hypothetical protein